MLREWAEEDSEWYAASIHDPEIQRFTSEPEKLTASEVRTAIIAQRNRPDAAGFVICDAATGDRLGNIGITRDGSVGEAAYWLASAARGRGVATRALKLISAWALRDFGIAEIRLWTHAENARSRQVAERAGYRRTPQHDNHRTVNGDVWPISTYVLVVDSSG
ncbi:hypothetical protein GCM10009872_48320 [Actinopolymorpha rutila]